MNWKNILSKLSVAVFVFLLLAGFTQGKCFCLSDVYDLKIEPEIRNVGEKVKFTVTPLSRLKPSSVTLPLIKTNSPRSIKEPCNGSSKKFFKDC